MRNRKLFILRHAKSAWDTDAVTDFDRPLARRGEKAIKKIGRWMLKNIFLPDLIISSPALRAKQTVNRICAQLSHHQTDIIWENIVYGADLSTLLKVLERQTTRPKTVMLTGHNPELEMLVEYLADETIPLPQNGKLMPTAALALFDMPETWKPLKPDSAKLTRIIYPRTLPKI